MTSTKLVVILASLFVILNISSGSIPSPPRNLTIDEKGSRNLNISWIRPADDGNSSSQLEYAVFYKQIGDKGFQGLVRGDTRARISELKPYKRYEIYVMAKSNDGYGPPTFKSANTAEEEPGKCPTIIYTERFNNESDLLVQWNKVPEEYQNGIIKGYVVFYRGKSMGNDKSVTVNGGSNTTYTFKNLSKEENYGFRVAAVNSVGLCKGYQSIPFYHEGDNPTTKAPEPATTTATTTATATTKEPSEATTKAPEPATTTATATATATATTKEPSEATTETPEPATNTKEPSEGTTRTPSEGGCKTNAPGETLARTADSNWLVYVLIALAVIVAIMGVTIFLLIWQLYKNHRFYKLRQEQYKMKSATPNMGTDNEAQDNAV